MTGGVYEWLRALQKRLKNVKVVCGDWSQVMGGNWRTADGICGVFLDPPYGEKAKRTKGVYREDSLSVADDVLQWCKENGDNRSYRIALCGYDGEHNGLEEMGWNVESWKAKGGYANTAKNESRGKLNCKRERIWFSPACIKEAMLFDF